MDKPASNIMDTSPADRAAGSRGGLVLALLLTLYTLSWLDRSILSLLIAPIKTDLMLTDLQVSLLIGFAFSIFYSVMGLPLGYVADVWSRRNLIAVGVSLWSLMTALGGLATGYATLFLSRMGVGLGEAALSPASYSMLSDIFPKARIGRAMAIYTVGAPLGMGLAMALGGLVVQAVASAPTVAVPLLGDIASWRFVLIVVGLPGVALGLAMLLVREPPRQYDPGFVAADHRPGFGRFLFSRWRVFAPLFLGLGMILGTAQGTLMWTPSFFLRTHAIAAEQAALPIGAIIGISGILGTIVGGIWADRLYARGMTDAFVRVLLFSAVSAAPFYVAMPLMPSATGSYACLFAASFCQMLQAGLPASSIRLVTPNHLRARMIATYVLVASLCGIGLGPTLVAFGTTHLFGEARLGWAMALEAAITMPLAMLFLALSLRPYRGLVENGAAR